MYITPDPLYFRGECVRVSSGKRKGEQRNIMPYEITIRVQYRVLNDNIYCTFASECVWSPLFSKWGQLTVLLIRFRRVVELITYLRDLVCVSRWQNVKLSRAYLCDVTVVIRYNIYYYTVPGISLSLLSLFACALVIF